MKKKKYVWTWNDYLRTTLIGSLWLFLIMRVGNMIQLLSGAINPTFDILTIEFKMAYFLHYRLEFVSLILIVGFLLLYYKKRSK